MPAQAGIQKKQDNSLDPRFGSLAWLQSSSPRLRGRGDDSIK